MFVSENSQKDWEVKSALLIIDTDQTCCPDKAVDSGLDFSMSCHCMCRSWVKSLDWGANMSQQAEEVQTKQ